MLRFADKENQVDLSAEAERCEPVVLYFPNGFLMLSSVNVQVSRPVPGSCELD